MYAVVEIAGTQFEVRPNDIVRVPLLGGNIGDNVTFDKLLLSSSNGSDLNIGKPYIGGSVTAKILAHGKDTKVIVFKKNAAKAIENSMDTDRISQKWKSLVSIYN